MCECLFVCMCVLCVHCSCSLEEEIRSEPRITGGCELPCGCWVEPGHQFKTLNCWNFSLVLVFLFYCHLILTPAALNCVRVYKILVLLAFHSISHSWPLFPLWSVYFSYNVSIVLHPPMFLNEQALVKSHPLCFYRTYTTPYRLPIYDVHLTA